MKIIEIFLLLTLIGLTTAGLADKPFMGWTSWDLCAIKNHPIYGSNWVNSTNVEIQSDAMKKYLQPFGYNYINIDSFWAADPTQTVDEYGRWTSDLSRFPQGFKSVSEHVHRNGQKVGIYLNPGLAKAAVNKNTPIEGTNCHAKDIAVSPLVDGNQFGDTYKINFSHPCAQPYMDSFARQLASWEVDFLKLDAIGPGSDNPNFDSRDDVKAWRIALNNTGREIWFELSWKVEVQYIAFWKQYANGWRIEDDVDCYCNTLLTWISVRRLFDTVLPFVPYASKGGWNDFDSVNVGNGPISGLSDTERQTYATFWAISATPFYTGNDLTQLDQYGLSLLTNTEVIEVVQQGRAAKPISIGQQQVWFIQNQDRSITVGLFNLNDTSQAQVSVLWKDLGFSGSAIVRDLWGHKNLGIFNSSYADQIDSHGSRLLKIFPN